MASESIMAAVHVPNSKDTSLTPLLSERNIIKKSTQCKTRQGGAAKNPFFLPMATNNQTANQALYDTPTKFVSDSQLQNKVTSLEQQVLEAKKTTLPKQF